MGVAGFMVFVRSRARAVFVVVFLSVLLPVQAFALYPNAPVPGSFFWLSSFVPNVGYIATFAMFGPINSSDGRLPPILLDKANEWSTNYFAGLLNQCNLKQNQDCAITAATQCIESAPQITCTQTYDMTIHDPVAGTYVIHSSFSVDLPAFADIPCPAGFLYNGDITQTSWTKYCSQPSVDALGVAVDSKSMTCNPCNASNGNKYQPEVDYSGRDGVVSFVRNYNSQFAKDIGLGFGWTSSIKRLDVG